MRRATAARAAGPPARRRIARCLGRLGSALGLGAALWLGVCPPTAPAQEGAGGVRLRVMVDEDPPFVVRSGDHWGGWAIDLWTEVARQAGLDWRIVGAAEPNEIVDALAVGKVDVGVGDLSVTKERVGRIDFSHPFFRGGLRVLVRERHGESLVAVLKALATPAHAKLALGALALLGLMSGLIFWLARRHDRENFPSGRLEGLVEAVYIAAGALLKGQLDRRLLPGVFARILTIVWMFFGAAVVAYVTAAVATVLTVRQLSTDYQAADDVRGKRIAAVAGTPEVAWLSQRGATVVPQPTLDEAIQTLRDGGADALVHDAPVLAWWTTKHPDSGVELVGGIFSRHDYAFALQSKSALRIPINVNLLSLEEAGFLSQLNQRWLGE